ncbi:hypothetical protein LCGC14_2645150, partial [marine sediment metagenome]
MQVKQRSAVNLLAEKMKKGSQILKEALKEAKKPGFADQKTPYKALFG